MPASLCKPTLSTQVLTILKNQGSVTIDMLHRSTEPCASKKNLRQSLGLLKKKGLVESLCLNSQTTFYQLSQALSSREQVANLLDSDAKKMIQPLLRKQDLYHNQWCEYWINAIKKMLPEAEIVRERTVDSNKIAKNVLQINRTDYDLLPDFLLILPASGTQDPTYIAFEIERTRKSNNRILRKLKKYMDRTRIDGLIYICDSGRLSETIRQLYESKLVDKTQRVKHYSDHFFLFSDSIDGGGPTLERLLNAKAELVQFDEWCLKLRNTKWTKRRDANFTL